MAIAPTGQRWMSIVRSRLEAMPKTHQKTFAALTCGRLIEHFERFSRETGWGKPEALRRAWLTCCEGAVGATVNKSLIEALYAECEAQMPLAERFSTPLVSGAIDAVDATCETLLFIRDDNIEHALQVVRAATDTADMTAQLTVELEPNDPGFETAIVRQEVWRVEIGAQESLLGVLEKTSQVTATLLKSLAAQGV